MRGVDVKAPEFGDSEADEFLLLDLRDADRCAEALSVTGRFDHVYQLAADMGGMGFIHAAECEIMRNSAFVNLNMVHAASQAGVDRYFFSSSVCIHATWSSTSPSSPRTTPTRPSLTTSTGGRSCGHGGYTEPVLAAGCRVTAVEASRHSLATLQRRYGANPGFRAVFDADGTLDEVDGTFSLVLIVSVLHHIPDYVSFLDRVTRLLAPNGSLLSLQDPLCTRVWSARPARSTAGATTCGGSAGATPGRR